MTAYEAATAAEAAMDAACKKHAGKNWLDARYYTTHDHIAEVADAKTAYDAACEEAFAPTKTNKTEWDAGWVKED